MIKFIVIIIFLTLPACSSAQFENLSTDSIKSMLCHKWEYRAVIIAGQEMHVNIEGTPAYRFFRDSTLEFIKGKKIEKGNWSYDSTQKLISVNTLNEKLYIRKLTSEEMFLITTISGSRSNNAEIAFRKVE